MVRALHLRSTDLPVLQLCVTSYSHNRVLPGHGKSWNLGRPFSRPGKSWKIAKIMESHGK